MSIGYPIARGVPRMLVDKKIKNPDSVNEQFTPPDSGLSREHEQTTGHFRAQGEAFAEEEKTFGMTAGESWECFLSTLKPPELAPDWFRDKLFVDAGCGHGNGSGRKT